jgi:hypothetical protein
MNGTAAAGVLNAWARGDHVHPTDTSLLPLAGGTMTGLINMGAHQITNLAAPTAAAQASTKGYVDTNFAPLASPIFTGTPTISGAATANALVLNAVAGSARAIFWETAGSYRWGANCTGTAEGGGNAGSDFQINRYSDAGALIDTPLSIVRSTGVVTITGGIAGTATNNNASAGQIGEWQQNSVTSAALSNATMVALTAVTLTAGDWDVWGYVNFNPSANATIFSCGVGPVSGSLSGWPAADNISLASLNSTTSSLLAQSLSVTPCRFSLASTVQAFLNAQANFASGTCSATAKIMARRVR